MQGDPVILPGDVRKRGVDDGQRVDHCRMAPLAGRCEGYAAHAPHEKRRSELELDLLDPLRHRAPREVQNLGCTLDIAVLRHGGEDTQGVQVRMWHRISGRQVF